MFVAVLLASASCGDDTTVNPQGPKASRDGAAISDEASSMPGVDDGAPADALGDADAPMDVPRATQRDAPPDAIEIDVSASSDSSVPQPPPDAIGADRTSDATDPADASLLGDGSRPGWRLVWQDEFDGTAGASPDGTKWTPQVGLNGSNAELEFYTARAPNLSLDGNGNLVITARRESYMGAAYTSARIESGGKFEQMYGRFETRVKLPTGQGLWPAFWIMGNNAQVGWPARGEIDIMENVGRDPTTNVGALHGPGYSGSMDFRATYMLAGGYSSDFHVFAAEWEMNVIRWYVDDNLFETRTPADLAARGGNLVWVYDHPFFIIFDVAVGGLFPGNPNATTPFPQSLVVDYVRVYAR